MISARDVARETTVTAEAFSNDLFFESITDSYVSENNRFLRRGWLAGEVDARLAEADCRFVLVTGEPGVGKSAFLAQLASEHPHWLRYFIRRDQISALRDVSAHSFLLRLGYQLAARRPELFAHQHLRIAVEQRIGYVSKGGEAVGVEIDRLIASPFHHNVLRIQQHVTANAGQVVGLRIEELVIEPRLIDTADLANMALADPARALLEVDPGARIVVLVDALDEVRYHNVETNLLRWLANCPALPANVRFVLTSRQGDHELRVFVEKQSRALQTLAIATEDARVTADVETYVERWLAELAHAGVFAHQGTMRDAQATRLANKANGNLGYLDALARAIDSASVREDAGALSRLFDLQRLPDSLQMLYGHFLHQIMTGVARQRIEMTDAETGETYDKPAWPSVDSRVLGVLCVALEPLSLAQIAELGGIRADWEYLVEAVGRLQQFLDLVQDRYRIYHSTVVEFLTADTTRDSTETKDLYQDPARWNRQIADALWRGKPSTLDAYGLNNLAMHLFRNSDTSRLGALVSKEWMLARYAGSGFTYGGYIADVDLALASMSDRADRPIVELCRLHVARHLAIARTDAYHVEDLLMLARLGRRDEALAAARLRTDPTDVFAVLIGVYELLEHKGERDSGLRDAAATAATAITAEQARFTALLRLGMAMARAGDPRTRTVLDDAWSLAGSLRREWVLADLAAALATAGDERSEQAFAEARVLADRMDYDPDSLRSQRPDAQLLLVRALLRAGRFADAADVAATMSGWDRLAFPAIAEALAEAGRFDEAEEMSRRIGDDHHRVLALCVVATAMARAGVSRGAALLGEAYDAAMQVEDGDARMSSLALVGTGLTVMGDARAQDAFAAARKALGERNDLLSQGLRLDLAENLARSGFVDEARMVAGGKADVLRRVTAALADVGDARAADVFEEVLGLVQASSGAAARSPVPIAMALVAHHRADAARQLARFVNWEYGRAEVLTIAAEGLVAEKKWDEARAVIASIGEPDQRAQAMAALAAAVNDGAVGPDLLEAESLAAGKTERLRRLAFSLARAGQGRLAMRALSAIPDGWDRHSSMSAVVEQLVDIEQFDQAADLARSIPDEHWRGRAFARLAGGLCAAGRAGDARQIATEIADASMAAAAWRDVAVALVRTGSADSSQAFTRARAAVDRIAVSYERVVALAALGEAMSGSADPRAGEVFAEAISGQQTLSGWKRPDAIASLALALDRAGDPRADELFLEALALTNREGLSDFEALRMPRDKVVDALIAAERVDQARAALAELPISLRIDRLIALGVTLARTGDARALESMREARLLCQYIADDPGRLMELEKIANAMAETGFLHEALITARPHHLDRYLGHLARWAPVLERQAPGLSIQVLCTAADVAAWFYRDWAQMRTIICGDS